MSDPTLLMFGCAVSFIALAGSYVYLRERFEAGPAPERKPQSDADSSGGIRRVA